MPLTYVSRDDAEAFCAANGVRLPTEIEWEAAARGGDDRLWPWGDEPPDATRATFGQGIGGPSRAGSHAAGAAPCGALDLAGNVYEWTADGAVRGGAYISGPDELRCSARRPMHPGARDTYIGFRVVDVESSGGRFDWVEVPPGDYVIGRDAGDSRQRVVDVDAFELTRTVVTNAQYERFVAETGTAPPPHWPAPRRPPGHVRRLGGGVGVLRLGRRPPADGGRVGEGGARHRRARVPVGRRGGGQPRRRRARAQGLRRRRSARTRPARARTVCWTWPATSGNGRRPSTRRASACSAEARSRARGSRGRGARCGATAGRCGGRRTSASGSREPPSSRTSGAAAGALIAVVAIFARPKATPTPARKTARRRAVWRPPASHGLV